MELLAPVYYKKFHCIADQCTHSCCVGWEIDVDGETLARYEALTAPIGEEIRASLQRTREGVCFRLGEDERCPNLDGRGLCRIITALGEGYLCEICREHPRFYNRVGNCMECGLGACCEEAARLMLQEADYISLERVDILPDEDACGTDFDARAARAAVLTTLSDQSIPYGERPARLAQDHALSLPVGAALTRLLDSLEYLDGAHKALLISLDEPADVTGDAALYCERFLAYLIYRHASAAQDAAAFRTAVGLALLLERLFRALTGGGLLSPVRAAVLLSEEMEYSEENTNAIRAVF